MNLKNVSSDELKSGILKAIENSEDLIKDGNILFDLERFPRAFAMFQFSNEELGKAMIFFEILILRELKEEIDYKKFNKQITQHQSKHRLSAGITLVGLSTIYDNYSGDKKSLLQTLLHKIDSAKIYDNYKNLSLYINITKNGFKTPVEQINKDIVEEIKDIAELNLKLYSNKIDERISKISDVAKGYKDFIKKPAFGDDFMCDLKEVIHKMK